MEKQRHFFSSAQSLGVSGKSPSRSHTLCLFPVSSRPDRLLPSPSTSFSLFIESSRPPKSPPEKCRSSMSSRLVLPLASAPSRSAPRCSQHRCRSPAEAVAAPQGSCYCCCCSGETQGASPSFVLLLQRRRRLLAIKLSLLSP